MTEDQLYELQQRQKQIGNSGEDYVLHYERQRLQGHPRINDIRIVGRHDVGLGYDIISFNSITSPTPNRFIEVKTYSGTPRFFLSEGEWTAADKHQDNYYLFLIDLQLCCSPDYTPIIINNPAKTLAANSDSWNVKTQQREFTYIPQDNTPLLPPDFDNSTVIIGCFNDNNHLNWILSSHCYNVRASVGAYHINGAIPENDLTRSPRYMVLYNVQSPRIYSVYSINAVTVATRNQMLSMHYSNPHSRYYMLYRLQEKIAFPNIDIMQLLRTSNDKVTRTSGTPIYIQGCQLRRYFLQQSLHPNTTTPKHTYTNTGKPWTTVQDIKLTDWLQQGHDIAYICHKLYRTPDEIHARMKLLGLE